MAQTHDTTGFEEVLQEISESGKRWQRSEQALITTIHDIYVMGVSTRKVKVLAESMGIEGISAAEVSKMAKQLDDQ